MTDPDIQLLTACAAGLLLGGLLVGLWLAQRYQRREQAAQLEHANELAELREAYARLEAKQSAESRASEEKLDMLKAARKQLEDEFSVLANRIFEEKSQRFLKTNKDTLETTLGPLKTQLKDFKTRVEDVYERESRDRLSLMHELKHLKQLNQQMSEDAVNLTRALKGDKKTQGNWGEIVLERVLEESGLRKGHEYETQFSARSAEGQRRQPDVVVRLPEGRDIVVDAKVSLVAYERYVTSENETDKQAALVEHVQAVRQHIQSLSVKGYEGLQGINSLDFVLLFIPIESAFMAAFDAEPAMFATAYDKNIIVVSPTTLLATLRTVQTLWRYEHQNRNAEKIAAQAGAIHDQFALVLESLEELGRHIERAQDSWDKTRQRMATGRGNLVKRVTDLEKLGARTKRSIPDAIQATAESDEHDDAEGPLLDSASEDVSQSGFSENNSPENNNPESNNSESNNSDKDATK
ncbi:MAG: DNA recombination protein RmuC [Pseudomonadota bacterium]